MALARTGDADRYKPSLSLSLEGACASTNSSARPPVIAAPTHVADDDGAHGEGDEEDAHSASETPHWGYSGIEGPGYWGSLHPDWAVFWVWGVVGFVVCVCGVWCVVCVCVCVLCVCVCGVVWGGGEGGNVKCIYAAPMAQVRWMYAGDD